MSDDDLQLLLAEEYRLFRVYNIAAAEESRYPQRVEKKRAAWEALYRKLNKVLTPEKRRELLQARAAEGRKR